MIGGTELKAVPHASLSRNLRNQDGKVWGFKPLKAYVASNSKSTHPKRQCTSADDEPMQRLVVLF